MIGCGGGGGGLSGLRLAANTRDNATDTATKANDITITNKPKRMATLQKEKKVKAISGKLNISAR